MVPPNRVKMGWQQGIKLLCFIVKWLYCSASLIVTLFYCFGFAQDFGLREATY